MCELKTILAKTLRLWKTIDEFHLTHQIQGSIMISELILYIIKGVFYNDF